MMVECSMLPNGLILERSYLACDVASVKAGMRAMKLLVASRAITRHCAEEVLAQCAEDLRSLTGRLRCIDAMNAAAHNV